MLHEGDVAANRAHAVDSQSPPPAEKPILWLLAVGGLVVGVCTVAIWPIFVFWWLPYSSYLCLLLFAVLAFGVVSAFRLARSGSYPFAAWILFAINSLIILDCFVALLGG